MAVVALVLFDRNKRDKEEVDAGEDRSSNMMQVVAIIVSEGWKCGGEEV